jgi:hypothetical protein
MPYSAFVLLLLLPTGWALKHCVKTSRRHRRAQQANKVYDLHSLRSQLEAIGDGAGAVLTPPPSPEGKIHRVDPTFATQQSD